MRKLALLLLASITLIVSASAAETRDRARQDYQVLAALDMMRESPSIGFEVFRQPAPNLKLAAADPPTIASSTPFASVNLRFMAPAPLGKDSNSGLDAAHPWATPNHPMHCGDVIIAASGSYPAFPSWGTVSSCPSTSGGIDGNGRIFFAVLLCGGASVGDCTITGRYGHGIEINASNWAVEGWSVSEGYSHGASGFAFMVNTRTSAQHHIAWINNIAHFNAIGFSVNSFGSAGGAGHGVDYWAIVGNIAQDSAGRCDGFWNSAIDIIGLLAYDTAVGTHVLVDGNFVLNSQQVGCIGRNNVSDGEGIMLDTLIGGASGLGFTEQIVVRDNIIVLSERFGLHFFYDGTRVSATVKAYNNTIFASSAGNYARDACCGNYGDININAVNLTKAHLYVYNNIARTNIPVRPDGGFPFALVSGGTGATANVVIGNTGPNPANSQNILKGLVTTCRATCESGSPPYNAIAFNSMPLGVNIYIDPAFQNAADVLANRIGTPNCSGFETTTACMGWDYSTQTATNPSVIYGMTPTVAAAIGKGYRPPGVRCIPAGAGADYSDFPDWLKGIVYLHWNGTVVQQKMGLSNVPCGR